MNFLIQQIIDILSDELIFYADYTVNPMLTKPKNYPRKSWHLSIPSHRTLPQHPYVNRAFCTDTARLSRPNFIAFASHKFRVGYWGKSPWGSRIYNEQRVQLLRRCITGRRVISVHYEWSAEREVDTVGGD